jgi:type I restriction enzyme S subunit
MEVKPGYKQTEVGVIPEDWKVQTLNEVSIISRLAGAEYTSLWKETPDGEIVALRGFNIGKGKIIDRDLVYISNNLSLRLKRSRLCKGDVVYPCVGSIGNAVVISDDNKYHIQQNIARITPHPEAISSLYLANYLMSSLGEREVQRFNASSSQPSVLVGSLRQYRVPLPPGKAEQEAIAGALSDVDALIASLDKLIAKKRDIKHAAMQQLLAGKHRLPGFSGEWVVKRLGDIANIQRGASPRPIDSPIWYDSKSTVGWVRISDIAESDGQTLLKTQDYLSQKGIAASRLLPAGSLIMSICATVGRPVITGFDTCIHDGFVGFSNLRRVDKRFLFYKLTQLETKFKAMGQTGSQANLNTDLVNRCEIGLPDPSEQIAIVTVLAEMDAEIAALEARRDKTNAIKQGMMQELLIGRIRLV